MVALRYAGTQMGINWLAKTEMFDAG